MSFSTAWLRKKKKTENTGESFSSGPTFFILAIWDEKWREESA